MDFVTRCRRGVFVALMAAAAFGMASCSDATGPNDYNAALAPASGSQYVARVSFTDAYGNPRSGIPSENDTIRVAPLGDSVSGISALFPGVANVLAFDNPSPEGTRYLRYLSNGDVQILVPASVVHGVRVDSVWLDLPFGTKSRRTLTVKDTSWVVGTGQSQEAERVKVTWAVDFIKMDISSADQDALMSLRPDKVLTVVYVTAHQEILVTSGSVLNRSWSEDTYQFAPKLKYFLQHKYGRMDIQSSLSNPSIPADTSGSTGYNWSVYLYTVK